MTGHLRRPLNPEEASVRPPPLPTAKPAPRPGASSHVKAALAIWRLRASAWVRSHRAVTVTSAAVVLVAAAAVAVVALDAVPDVALLAPKTLTEARERVRAHPNDAAARRNLGHMRWDGKRHHRALAEYGRALAMDASVADDRMIANLVASYGGRDQRNAQALIVKYKLVAAEPGLEKLAHSRRRSLRWGAVHTLDQLERGTRENWETAYILDLESPDCDVRRTAVDKLGAIGSRRALSALRAAAERDEKSGGWWRSRCLGDRVGTAQQRILARR